MEKLYIVIPAYNEQENIRDVIDQWYPVVEKTGSESRLVIVNDGSKDDTYRIMQSCAETRPQFVPLTKENSGHGATLLYAYRYALEQGADYVFQTDSDGQTLPEEFAPFWEQRNEYDLLIGDRWEREDGFSRVVVTKVLKAVLLLCFGVRVQDANTPYRLMRAEPLRENLQFIPADFNLSNVMLSVIYARRRQNVRYIPITFRPRQGGVNSINIPKIIRIGWNALRDFRKIDRSMRAQGI